MAGKGFPAERQPLKRSSEPSNKPSRSSSRMGAGERLKSNPLISGADRR
jgi:hypothetical protein